MKLGRKIMAILMAAMMMISMLPASAEIVDGADSCYHEWAWSWPDGKPANCQDWKVSQEYCKKCGQLGGSYEQCGPCEPGSKQWITSKPGNCMEYGVWEITCKHCGEWLDGAEEPGSHNWATNVLEQPTCTEDGWKETLCTVCGSEKDAPEKIPAKGHDWSDWKTEIEATCTQEGFATRRCKRCGDVDQKYTDLGSHNWGDWKVVEPGDCEHPALEERVCKNCGESQHREGESNDHRWGSWETVKEPTCAEAGRKERECRRCGEEQSRSIEKLDHSFGPWTVIQEPSAEGPGIRERVCAVCGYAEQEEFYPEGTLVNGDRGDLVEKLQEALNEAGYDCGTADGIFGKKTEGAIKDYQEETGMTVDGIAWPDLINDLIGYVRFEKKVISEPANGEFYVPGETIEYVLEATNIGDVYLIEIEITDPLKGSNEDAVVSMAENLDVGQGMEYSFSYTVTEADAAAGQVVNQATMRFMDSDIDTMLEIQSNEVITPAGAGTLEVTPGEDGTEDTADAPADGGLVAVPLDPDSPWDNIINLPGWPSGGVEDPEADSGDTDEGITGEPITGEDGGEDDGDDSDDIIYGEPIIGDPDDDDSDDIVYGEPTTGNDNVVWVDTPATEGDTGYITVTPGDTTPEEAPLVYFEKFVESLPLNGSYYEPGETIHYGLHVENVLDNAVHDVEIWDPLKGGNEDGCVDRIPILDAQGIHLARFTYTVTEKDVAQGFVFNQAVLKYFDPVGDAYLEVYSNEVVVSTGGNNLTDVPVDPEIPGADDPTDDPFGVETGDPNGDPADDPFGVETGDPNGDPADDPFGVETGDPNGDPTDDPFGVETEDPEEEPDKPVGFPEDDPGEEPDKPVGFPEDDPNGDPADDPFGVETEDPEEKSGVTISKRVYNTPANAQYFVPGETITFSIEVRNIGKPAKTNVTVSDPLMAENGGVWTMDYLENFTATGFYFDYTVTETNAIVGSVTNIASVQCWDEDGNRYAAASEPVTVPCGFEEGNLPPFGVITGLSVVKEEISAPANGLYYTEGENISYRITYTNSGETEITNVKIYDTLRGVGTGKEIDSCSSISSGASHECFFNHVVTAQDVERGYVANAAIANYEIGGGYTGSSTSNTVICDTDGMPDEGVGKIDFDKLGGGERICCTRTLTAVDGASEAYELVFCEEHAETMQAAQTMASVAGSEAAKAKAYAFAGALWRDEIGKMYDEILEACDELAKITVLSERARFDAMVANNSMALKTRYPDMSVAEAATAEILESKCTNLCYELHSAPDARVDSLLRVQSGDGAVPADGACTREISVDDGKSIVYTDRCCADHALSHEMTLALLEADSGAETWEMLRTLWDMELLAAYENIGTEAERAAFMAEYAAYVSWIESREAVLQLFYPENPEIVAEVIAETIMGRVIDTWVMMK